MARKTFQDALYEIKTKGKKAENLRLHLLETDKEIKEYLDEIEYEDANFDLLKNNAINVYKILFKNNKEVGLLALDEDDKYIHDIYIMKKYSGKGYFKETLIFCIEKKNCTKTSVNKFNKRAVIGYISYNFVFKGFDDNGDDYYLMEYDTSNKANNQRTLYMRV